ncbi:hypothetical protein [Cryobacterium cheniae]|uniref:hypothetical protein n=1 Tax=Cryobacterium cheniae TaxID=1259262 RepID=UPI003B97290D
MDTTSVSGELVFSVFAAVAEFERARISERAVGALVTVRPREGERPIARTAAKVHLAMAATGTEGNPPRRSLPEFGVTPGYLPSCLAVQGKCNLTVRS